MLEIMYKKAYVQSCTWLYIVTMWFIDWHILTSLFVYSTPSGDTSSMTSPATCCGARHVTWFQASRVAFTTSDPNLHLYWLLSGGSGKLWPHTWITAPPAMRRSRIMILMTHSRFWCLALVTGLRYTGALYLCLPVSKAWFGTIYSAVIQGSQFGP